MSHEPVYTRRTSFSSSSSSQKRKAEGILFGFSMSFLFYLEKKQIGRLVPCAVVSFLLS
jgi:hypothetical protein